MNNHRELNPEELTTVVGGARESVIKLTEQNVSAKLIGDPQLRETLKEVVR